jgi:hypothetical protein
MTDAPVPPQSPADATGALLGSARVFIEGLVWIIRIRMDGAARFTARLRQSRPPRCVLAPPSGTPRRSPASRARPDKHLPYP